MVKICEYCGKRYKADRSSRKFCSKKCNAYVNSIKNGKETRFKKGIVPFNKKNNNNCIVCNKVIPSYKKYCSRNCYAKNHKGKHHSPKTEFKKGIKQLKGKNSPNWKGGKTPYNKKVKNSEEFRIWRKAVFERDNYTCQLCKKRGILNAHHIKRWSRFPELRTSISNGITLCVNCHKEITSRVIWLFGNSGAGKTYLAKKILKVKYAIWIDGDMARKSFNKDLGFSRKDRIENNLRIAKLVKEFKKQEFDIIVSTICPFVELRKEVKEITNCKFIYIEGGKEGKEYPFDKPEIY